MELVFDNLESVLMEFADRFQELYKQKIKNGDSYATGDLYNSIRTYFHTKNGETYLVEMSLLDYWLWVERGRSKGAKRPPTGVIEKWIIDKGIVPKADENGRVPSIKSLAYLISRKIGIEGIEPKPYYQQSFQELWSEFEERVKDAIDKDAEQIALVIMKEYVEANLQDLPIKYQRLF